MKRIYLWLAVMLVFAGVLYWLVGVERQIFRTEVIPDMDPEVPGVFSDQITALDDWKFEDMDAFFVEYRLQRDRVRGQEIELLTEFINNPNTSSPGKTRAEEQLLSLVDIMEKELLVENLVKAQGYSDAIFFYSENRAHLVLKGADLTESQFAKISEMVSIMTGVKMEEVVIIENLSG